MSERVRCGCVERLGTEEGPLKVVIDPTDCLLPEAVALIRELNLRLHNGSYELPANRTLAMDRANTFLAKVEGGGKVGDEKRSTGG